MSRKGIDLHGRQFGRLKVIRNLGLAGGWRGYIWECVCTCGTIRRIPASTLNKGRASSCGCIQKEKLSAWAKIQIHPHTLPPGQAAFNVLIYKYKCGARRRGLPFTLDVDLFRELVEGLCVYCSQPPKTVARSNQKARMTFTHNGIDRVNNDEGYTPLNCVTCCKLCNQMKHSLSRSDFLEHIQRIADNSIKAGSTS